MRSDRLRFSAETRAWRRASTSRRPAPRLRGGAPGLDVLKQEYLQELIPSLLLDLGAPDRDARHPEPESGLRIPCPGGWHSGDAPDPRRLGFDGPFASASRATQAEGGRAVSPVRKAAEPAAARAARL